MHIFRICDILLVSYVTLATKQKIVHENRPKGSRDNASYSEQCKRFKMAS